MCRFEQSIEPEVASRLRAGGCLLYGNPSDSQESKLQIQQNDYSYVWCEGLGPLTFILDVEILGHSIGPPAVVDRAWIQTPWKELHMDWQQDFPEVAGPSLFEVDGYRGMKFRREDVINDRLFGNSGLKSHTVLRGLLVGSSVNRLPREYRRGKVFLQLWLQDQLGKYWSEVETLICWSKARVRAKDSPGLFEPLAMGGVQSVEAARMPSGRQDFGRPPAPSPANAAPVEEVPLTNLGNLKERNPEPRQSYR